MSRPITCPLCSRLVDVLDCGVVECHGPARVALHGETCPASGTVAPFHVVTASDGPFPAPVALTWPVDANGMPV